MSLNINLADPNVQRLMGAPALAEPTDSGRELMHLAGDPDTGLMSTVSLSQSAIAHPIVRYKEFVLELDVYKTPDEPMYVHLICPRCHNMLTISAKRKRMELRDGGERKGGIISIEPFECTWEMEPNGRRVGFGLGLCRLKLAIDENIAKDA